MRVEKCFFCSSPIYPGHGIHFVRNDSKIFRFCRSKCHKAFQKKRNPRKARWTKAFRKAAGKELTVDPSLEFEKRRNEPVKYNKELWQTTIKAMKRIEEIKVRRQNFFIANRLKKGKELRKAADLREVKDNIHLIKSPAAGLKQRRQLVEVIQEQDVQAMESN
ncbi:probable ribosome biogenesis protein RLP24 [Biomphalaria glabrata]|uniref:Probable ribosome biogenesis protein RLP24 n=3 Tax=Biomphalaria TaxID=6525 RepID=A0A9W3A4G5_BIOGL|nr:probable ribosome biogenesis protein RLP24 [Biomphalaria glabrata]KAI8782333.1 ribosome biogenesis protein RLP24 [Biomphalaria glabrata]KAK0044733.1 ribosome biogenesis protein RLP24 [Biomphalaria pfeifferi]